MGGFLTQLGGLWEAIRPNRFKACLNFPRLSVHGRLARTLDFIPWPSDGSLETHGKLGGEGAWWVFEDILHRSVLGKNTWMSGGTWDSNPGPKTYMPTPLPTVPLSLFDIIVGNEWDKWESADGLRKCAKFKLPNLAETRPSSSSYFLQIKHR